MQLMTLRPGAHQRNFSSTTKPPQVNKTIKDGHLVMPTPSGNKLGEMLKTTPQFGFLRVRLPSTCTTDNEKCSRTPIIRGPIIRGVDNQ